MPREIEHEMHPLEAYFWAIMKKKNVDLGFLAGKLYYSPSTVAHQMRRPWDRWTFGQVVDYCVALDTPIDGAMLAAVAAMKGDSRCES